MVIWALRCQLQKEKAQNLARGIAVYAGVVISPQILYIDLNIGSLKEQYLKELVILHFSIFKKNALPWQR